MNVNILKVGHKSNKRLDNAWSARFFFSFYFRPILNEKSKSKIVQDYNGVAKVRGSRFSALLSARPSRRPSPPPRAAISAAASRFLTQAGVFQSISEPPLMI
ncbi:hypothetical protein NL676_037575 [Syzygium grande]|nr:hypothetical protein NL676_037575 [Syzygium grande]